jgi:exportin-1
LALCEHSANLLCSEEIFDFSRGRMTRTKTQNLKDSLTKDFYAIFQLCDYVLSSSSKPSLLLATLNALERFLQWIPLGYIFETGMVMLLAQKFFPEPIFRNASLQCLTEVAALEIDGQDDKFQTLFNAIMMALSNILPLSRSRSANSRTFGVVCVWDQFANLYFIKNYLSPLTAGPRRINNSFKFWRSS